MQAVQNLSLGLLALVYISRCHLFNITNANTYNRLWHFHFRKICSIIILVKRKSKNLKTFVIDISKHFIKKEELIMVATTLIAIATAYVCTQISFFTMD